MWTDAPITADLTAHLDHTSDEFKTIIQEQAVSTHATFRETGSFKFNTGHDVSKLYGALPESLREEITAESEVFARQYVSFRAKVEASIEQIFSQRLSKPLTNPDRKRLAEAEWNELAKSIRESNYTAFVNSNDPGSNNKYLREGWFEEALNQVKLIEEPGDITQYFRYAPHKDKDDSLVKSLCRSK